MTPLSQTGRAALDVAIEAGRRAGAVSKERFFTTKTISYKGSRTNLVTDVDLAAEKAVLDLLRLEYPGFSILSEESAPLRNDSPYTWVVDPIDGTRNYALGIPHFCVVVALAKGDDLVLGVTYDPIREELFTAQKGQGAYLNGQRISVSAETDLCHALLDFDLGYINERAGLALDMVRALWPGMSGLRLMGSSALGLAYAACGRFDLYLHHSLSPWDIAAGLLLVREAGGEVVDRQGAGSTLYSPSVIASNRNLINGFLQATDGLPWRQYVDPSA